MTLATCGVTAHDEACLCDVHITEPVPVRFGFDQVWGADVVMRAKGWDGTEGGDALASYLEALAYGYDNTRHMADFDANWDEHDGGILRQQVLELLAGGVSMIDVPNVVGDSFARCLAAFTDGQPSPVWTWDEPKWAAFEDALLRTDATAYELGKQFNVAESTMRKLMPKYGIDPKRSGIKKQRLKRIKELCREGGYTVPQIRRILIAEGLDEGKKPTALDNGIRRVLDNKRY